MDTYSITKEMRDSTLNYLFRQPLTYEVQVLIQNLQKLPSVTIVDKAPEAPVDASATPAEPEAKVGDIT